MPLQIKLAQKTKAQNLSKVHKHKPSFLTSIFKIKHSFSYFSSRFSLSNSRPAPSFWASLEMSPTPQTMTSLPRTSLLLHHTISPFPILFITFPFSSFLYQQHNEQIICSFNVSTNYYKKQSQENLKGTRFQTNSHTPTVHHLFVPFFFFKRKTKHQRLTNIMV